MRYKDIAAATLILLVMTSCSPRQDHAFSSSTITAEEILGNPYYQAISFGAYRETSRDIQPTMAQLREDVELLHAMGIRLLRTYNVHFDEAANLLEVIREMKREDPDFEMYVMLGAWIDAKHAWTDEPERIRHKDAPRNAKEIARAAELAALYPDIVKIIAVGNEAMVHWATEYYVEPSVILHWVNVLQQKKARGELPETLWITSSDNFASWGGGGPEYHNDDLNALIHAVDFISMHTYPMHDTHYNPMFWGVPPEEAHLTDRQKIHNAMQRALDYAVMQYEAVVDYMKSVGADKPVHIGETGWATISNEYYGVGGANAIDEYKAGLFHRLIRDWSDEHKVTVFYFAAFDEPWKDAGNPLGSENHFGLINLQAQAKFALWDLVDKGVFDGLTRDGNAVTKTYNGDLDSLLQGVLVPPGNAQIRARLNNQ